MSISITINDTHKAIQNLEAKGASKELAEGIVSTFERATLADDPAKQGDILRLERQIPATENRLIVWVISAQIAGTGLLLATKLFT